MKDYGYFPQLHSQLAEKIVNKDCKPFPLSWALPLGTTHSTSPSTRPQIAEVFWPVRLSTSTTLQRLPGPRKWNIIFISEIRAHLGGCTLLLMQVSVLRVPLNIMVVSKMPWKKWSSVLFLRAGGGKCRLHLMYGLVFCVWYVFRYISHVVYFYFITTFIICLSRSNLCYYSLKFLMQDIILPV